MLKRLYRVSNSKRNLLAACLATRFDILTMLPGTGTLQATHLLQSLWDW